MWPLVATQSMDINTDPCSVRTKDIAFYSYLALDITMAPGGNSWSVWHSCSMALRHQHAIKYQARLWASALLSVVTRVIYINTDSDVVGPWTQTWPSAVAEPQMSSWPRVASRPPPTSACSLPPSLLQFHFFPQHLNWSASLSLPFLHNVFAHHIGNYLLGTTRCQAYLWLSAISLSCDDPGGPVSFFSQSRPWGPR